MTLTTLRRFLIVASAVLFLTLALPVSSSGETKTGHEFIFFSDAAHTHQIGIEIVCANGQTFRSGQTSGFVVVEPSGC
ncbi:MAG TPA: hypothetical protein VKZ53_14660 [Candidatus Angelobacter sp.]|nr:hypothetical protein [Candidatus Angelobacter sp.]